MAILPAGRSSLEIPPGVMMSNERKMKMRKCDQGAAAASAEEAGQDNGT
jgi:hypothetical protein